MKRKICIFVLLFCILQVNIFVPSTSIYAVDDIDDNEFIGLSPEKAQVIYDLMKEPGNEYRSNIYHYDNFMESYFDNLTINHGSNVAGSCGYVGIDMLLSYYDTYLNDNIVPDQYDRISNGDCYNILCRRNSPGSLFDEPDGFVERYKDKTDMSLDEIIAMNTEYYNYIDQQKNISLHAKLITMGYSLGYYNYVSTSPAGSSHYVVKQVINKYMSDVLGYNNGNEYVISDIKNGISNDSNDVRDFVIEKICAGFPVLLSVEDEDGGGHWVIAYDYDETTDNIYCNFGWGGSATHTTPENYIDELGIISPKLKNFSIYDTALTIEFNIPHVHSYNYAVTSTFDGEEITNYYCYDSSEIEIYDNEFEVISSNFNIHKINFSCGDSKTEAHIFGEFSLCEDDDSKHVRKCVVCGYEKKNSHIRQYTNIGTSTHNVKCTACGYDKTVFHNFICDETIDSTHYEKCSDCEYRITQLTNFEFTNISENTHSASCITCDYSITEDHNYDYRGYNSTHHEKYCVDCGYVESRSRHSFRLADKVGNYNRCLSCGAMIYVGGNDIYPVQSEPPKDSSEETE